MHFVWTEKQWCEIYTIRFTSNKKQMSNFASKFNKVLWRPFGVHMHNGEQKCSNKVKKNVRTTEIPDRNYDIIHQQNSQNFHEIPKILKIYNTVLLLYFSVSISKGFFLYLLCLFDSQSRQNHLATSTFDTNNVFKVSALPLILDTILWNWAHFVWRKWKLRKNEIERLG